jgi:hypothetical protein
MDEAHVLKDKGSFRWKNLMAVARHARQRLMLTGTPLQNDLHVSLSEIFCYLLHWCFYSMHPTALLGAEIEKHPPIQHSN